MNSICKSCTRFEINCGGEESETCAGCIRRVDNRKYPKYVKRDGYIGTFVELTPGVGCRIPVYRFPGGDSVVDDKELSTGSNDREELLNRREMKRYTEKQWAAMVERAPGYFGKWEANPFNLSRVEDGELPAEFIGKRNMLSYEPGSGTVLLTEGIHFTIG